MDKPNDLINAQLSETAGGHATTQEPPEKLISIPYTEVIVDGDGLSTDWNEPVRFGETPEIDYPLNALSSSIRNAVEEVQSHTQAPIALIACSALAAVSAAAQGLVDVARSETLCGPCSLFFLAIAPSGERKSAIDALFTSAIKEFEWEQRLAMEEAINDFEAKYAAWEAKWQGAKATITKLTKEGKSAALAEQELHLLKRDEPKPPKVPRVIFEDATPEALAYHLASRWPTASITSAEGGTVLGGASMSSEAMLKTLSLFNKLWSGESLVVDRKTQSSYIIDCARLTICVQVQPGVLELFIKKTGGLASSSGFFPRTLPCMPKSTQGFRKYVEPPKQQPALQQFNKQIKTLLNAGIPYCSQAPFTPQIVGFSPDGKKAWINIYNRIEEEIKEEGELCAIRDFASKAAENIARLACLFHTFEGKEGLIDAEAVARAQEIVLWHLNEAKRIFRHTNGTGGSTVAQQLSQWLQAECLKQNTDRVDKSYVMTHGPNGVRRVEQLDKVLGKLEPLNHIRLIKEGRKNVILVNPALLDANL